MRSLLTLLVVLVPLIKAQQQQLTVGTPVLGFVVDAAHGAVRPLLGVPGSAVIAPASAVAPALAVAASAQDIVVGVEAETGKAVLISPTGRSDLNLPAAPTRIAISPQARSAALYYPDAAKIRLVSGLPRNPRLAGEVDVPGDPSLMAVSDDGARVLAVLPGPDGDALWDCYMSGGTRIWKRAGHVTAIAFVPGSSKALLAESEASSVSLLGDLGSGPEVIADERDGITGVAAIAAFSDASAAVIAMSDGRIAIRQKSDGRQIVVSCGCQPTELAALRGGAAFRMTSGIDAPTWILDAGGTEPRIVFAARSEGGAQ